MAAYNGVVRFVCGKLEKAVKRLRLNLMGLGSERRRFLPAFCVGLFLGIVTINIGKSIILEDVGLFDEDILYRLKYMTADGNALFCYVFRKRIVRLLALVVLSTTYLARASCMGLTFWYGLSAGGFLTAMALRYGIKGIILAAVSMFPQYLFYVPAVLALLIWCEELFREIYVRGELNGAEKRFFFKKAGRLIFILAAVTAGCFLEGYVNPFFLSGYLKIF